MLNPVLVASASDAGRLPEAPRTSQGWFSSWFDRWDALILVAVVLVYALVAMSPFAPKKFGDLDFHRESKVLASAIRGQASWSQVEFIRAPGPDLFYLTPYLTVTPGSSDDVYWTRAFAWTALWMTASLLWIRRATALLFGDRASLIAMILALATPFWAYYSYGINGESCAFLALSIAVYGWARWLPVAGLRPWRGAAWMTWGGLIFFLLCKPNAVPMLALVAVCAWVLWRSGLGESKRVARFIALGVLGAAITAGISAETVRILSYRPSPQQPRLFRLMALSGSFQCRTEPWDWRFWREANRPGGADYPLFLQQLQGLERQSGGDNLVLSELEWNWVVNDFLTHPLLRLRMTAVRSLMMHVPFVNSQRPQDFRFGPLRGPWGFWLVQLVPMLGYLVLGAGAFLFIVRQGRDSSLYWVLWAPWIALLAFHAVIYAEPRYLFPAQGGMLIMASAVLSGARRRNEADASRLQKLAVVLQQSSAHAPPVLCVDLDGR